MHMLVDAASFQVSLMFCLCVRRHVRLIVYAHKLQSRRDVKAEITDGRLLYSVPLICSTAL